MTNPFIYDTSKPSQFIPPHSMCYWRRPLRHKAISLSWLQAFDECEREGRAYTELHFYRHPETDELVITYWEIEP